MSRGINKVSLIGNVGKKDVSAYPSGDKVVNIRLATTSSWLEHGTGKKKEETQWHNLVVSGRLADIVDEYVVKGNLLYIEGALKYSKWTDRNGVEKDKTEIIVRDLQMLGK